jgi:hypothetical protein
MMHVSECSMDEATAAERIADFFSPAQVDQTVRQAIQFCWMALPKERRNADELGGKSAALSIAP